MICGFCNREFEEDRSQSACRACPLGSDCGLVRCPYCGYENPGTPRVVSFFKGLFGKGTDPVSPVSHGRGPGRRELPVLPLGRKAEP